MQYKHFLLTRFNIKIASMLTKQLDAIDISSDEKYLEERFRLFFEYTVPSVAGQTQKNFVWIVMFSDNTPDVFKKRIAGLQDELSVFKPIFVKDNESSNKLLDAEILKHRADVCVTSRVDNDDALALDFIETVQQFVINNSSGKYALIFNNGYQYEEKSGIATFYRFPKNHFSTLVAPFTEKSDTILDYGHMDIQEKVSVVEVNNDKPLWLEVIHGTNVSNRMHASGKSIIKKKDALKVFGLVSKSVVVPKFANLYSVANKPLNAIRLLKHYGLKKTVSKVFEKAIKFFKK